MGRRVHAPIASPGVRQPVGANWRIELDAVHASAQFESVAVARNVLYAIYRVIQSPGSVLDDFGVFGFRGTCFGVV